MRPLLALFSALLIASLGSTPCLAQTIDWTGGGSTDDWDDKFNWSGGNIPDDAAETARFNVAGSFPVELPAGFTINDLISLAGLPQLQPSSGVNPTLTVGDDLIANGGAFYLSAPGGEKLTIDVNDELRIDGGGGFTADTSGGGVVTIFVGDLRLADAGSGSGDLTLIGQETVFEQTGLTIINLGQDGPAQFTLSDRARATFAAPLQLANFADANTASIALVESGSRLNLNSLQIAPGGFSAGVSGNLTVTGTNSTVTTSGFTTIGGTSQPVGSLSVTNGGRFDSGGLTTVAASGTLNVDGGTLNAMAGLDASDGTLNHTGGTIRVTGGDYEPVDSTSFANFDIDGAGDPAVELGAGARMFGPSLFVQLAIGAAQQGSLRIDSGAIANPLSARIGQLAGSTGTVTVTDDDSQLGASSVYVGNSGNGTLAIEAGGDVFAFSLMIVGNQVGSQGQVTVTGSGSYLLAGNNSGEVLHVGARGQGNLDVNDQALVEASNLSVASFGGGGSTGVGAVVIDDAQVTVENDLRVGTVGTATVALQNGGALSVSDESYFGAGGEVTVAGGAFSSGRVVNQGGRLLFNDGSLEFTSPFQPLLVGPAGMSIGGVAIEQNNTVTFPTLFSNESVTVAGDMVFTPGGALTLSGGQLDAARLLLSTGSVLSGVSGSELAPGATLQMAIGSTLEVWGDVALGDPTAPDGVVIAGKLDVNFYDVTLEDANDAVIDSGGLVELGGGGGGISRLIAPNGLTVDFGANITDEANGTVDTPNDPTKPLINNGHIAGNSLANPITLTGYVKGVGTCDNCVITGTDAPGFSPATVIRGSVAYRGALEIEIGGSGSGDFDRLEHRLGAGVADLGGELQVALLNGYAFASGDAFEFLTADGGVTGVFASESLPALGGGLGLDVLYGADSVTLAVVGIEGDYNYDGVVDAADYTVWRDALGQTGEGLAADGDNNGVVEAADYAVWQANYGATAAALATTIPEPASGVLLLITCLGRPPRQRA